MLSLIKSKARRGVRRARYAALCAVSAAIGAGFATTALYAALLQSGQSHAMASLILGCIWFGLSGVFLLAKGAVGEDREDYGTEPRVGSPHVAHPNGHAATAPSVAEAFMNGVNEGAGFARMQQRGS